MSSVGDEDPLLGTDKTDENRLFPTEASGLIWNRSFVRLLDDDVVGDDDRTGILCRERSTDDEKEDAGEESTMAESSKRGHRTIFCE